MKLTIYCDEEKDIPDQEAHVNIDVLQTVLEIVIGHLQTRVAEQRDGAVLAQHSGNVFSRPECIFRYCPYTEQGLCTDEMGGCINPNGNYKGVATEDEGDNAPS